MAFGLGPSKGSNDSPASPPALLAEGLSLAGRIPRLRVEARRVAATITAGWHGRARAGHGEDFWQFRPFQPGEPARLIDWRRSARDHHLYVREQELENAHTIWLWADLSPSMSFRSVDTLPFKQERALVLLLALAEVLADAGERIGILGQPLARSGRHAVNRLVEDCLHLEGEIAHTERLKRAHDVVLISDFLSPEHTALSRLAGSGVRAHLVEVFDPAEETFPFDGRVEFIDPEGGGRLTVGRAESLRAAYGAELARHREQLKALARRSGWSFLTHHTDRAATEPLLALHALLGEGGK